MTTTERVVDFVLSVLLGAAVFVITAAVVGVWFGLALRFVWVLQ